MENYYISKEYQEFKLELIQFNSIDIYNQGNKLNAISLSNRLDALYKTVSGIVVCLLELKGFDLKNGLYEDSKIILSTLNKIRDINRAIPNDKSYLKQVSQRIIDKIINIGEIVALDFKMIRHL